MSTPIKLTCTGCKHKWPYKGKREYRTTCPNCGNTVYIRHRSDDKDKQDDAQ